MAINTLNTGLAKLSRRRGWGERLRQHSIFLNWPEIAGHELAKLTRPEVIRKDVLFLLVADAVTNNRLIYAKGELLQKINDFLGSRMITDIRAKIGPIKTAAIKPVKRPISLDPRLEDRARKRFNTIQDKETASALFRLWQTFERRGSRR